MRFSYFIWNIFLWCNYIGVSAILGAAFLVVYALILVIWLLDRINLVSKGIFVACPNCKNKYLIPTYICPECGVSLSGTGSKPLCIPVIGGRSSGKTAYITAFSYEFIEKVAPRNSIEIKHYNEETENFYKTDIRNDYMGGTTRMTKAEMDLKQVSSKAFSFIVHHNKMNPDRLVQIYDVAGESFVDNTENEEQLQYSYCQGIIFMLDPLSIPTVRNYLDDSIRGNYEEAIAKLTPISDYMDSDEKIAECERNLFQNWLEHGMEQRGQYLY